jgi:hypothetical protein
MVGSKEELARRKEKEVCSQAEKEMTSSTEDVRSTADCRRAGRMRLTV